MGRRNSKKKSKPQRNSKKKSGVLVQAVFSLFPYVTSFGLIGALIGGSYAYAIQSDLFVLKTVTIQNYKPLSSEQRFRFAGVKEGELILTVDLKTMEQAIQKRHPEYKEVVVHRVLPNEILIDLKKRLPFARLKLSRTFWIDDTGVVVSPEEGQLEEYPLILGVPKPRQSVHVGSRIRFDALQQAIQLLSDIELQNILRDHALDHLDLSDRRNFVLRIDGGIDVHLGARNWGEKLAKLAEAIDTLEIDREKVRYIDLRFDDIIIGPR